ncbi:MAG TPA: hypothetical protein VGA82_02675 [Dehalococcoidales bacterium]
MGFGWKFERAGRILTWGAILAILIAFLPVLPSNVVRGAGWLILSPDEGKIGDRIGVDGAGFVSGQTVRVYFSSDSASVGDGIGSKVTAYETIGEGRTDASGSFYERLYFMVPGELTDGQVQKNVTEGDYYIYVTYPGSGRIVAAAKFCVPGPTVLSPSRGRIGDWVGINSSGLKSGDAIYIFFSSQKASIGQYIDGQVTIYQSAGTALVTADGTLGGGVACRIPDRLTSGKFGEDVHGGEYYFYITYYVTRTKIATVSRFVVLDGEIQLEPAEGAVGTEVKISGQGLRSTQKIMVKYDGEEVGIASGDRVTDSAGRFNCAFIVPEGTSGYHVIVASDVTGNKPEAHFRVKPRIMLAPTSAIVNQLVEVRGSGFGEVESLTLMVNGERLATSPAIVTTNHLGGFTFSFAAPPAAVNTTAKVEVSDKAANRAEAPLTVLPLPPAAASITLTPVTSLVSPGYVGQQVTVDGTRFRPGTAVEVTYGREETITTLKSNTDSQGSFSTTLVIPPSPAGAYTITATDGTNTASATFVMESSGPVPPTPLLPKVASAAERVTFFDWDDVQDPSGVTYSLQIATDPEFTGMVLEKKGLTTSEYVLTAAERLKPMGQENPYYCRVKAIDRAGNEGVWTPGVPFFVGLAGAPMANWVKFTLIGLGVVLVGVVALWVLKVAPFRR